MNRAFLFFALSSLAVTGCKKKEEVAASAPVAATMAKPGPVIKLPDLGLQLDLAGDVRVDKAYDAVGHQLDLGDVGSLEVVLMDAEQTLEEFKAKAESEPKNPTEEKLADGWAMTSENNSATKKLYIVDARRKIDGKFYKCNAYVKTPEKAAEALSACKSLRK